MRTEYSPDLSFGPWLGQNPALCLTFVWETVKCRLEGHPGWWDGERRVEPAQLVVPFVGAGMWNCSLAVQLMAPSWEVQLGLSSGDLQLFDLRLADSQLRGHCQKRRTAEEMASPFSPRPVPTYSPPDLVGDFHWGSPHLHSPPRSPEGQLPSGLQTPAGASGADGFEVGSGPRPVVEEMEIDCERVPVIRLIQTRVPLPEGEALHLSARAPSGGVDGPDPDESFFKVRYALLQEGTSMVQVQLQQSLVQWPYLTDMSLISAIISVFVPTWAVPPADLSAPPPLLQPYPWLYVNVLLTDSQLYIPLLSPHMPAGTSPWEDADLRGGPLFPRLAQLLVRKHSPLPPKPAGSLFRHQSSIMVTDPRGMRATLDLQHLGLAVTMSHLRFGYFYGGDCESRMKVDLAQLAAHLRDPQAIVTCFLLPVEAVSFEWATSQPTASENAARMQRLRTISRSVLLIQRAWRNWISRRGGTGGRGQAGGAQSREEICRPQQQAGASRPVLAPRATVGLSEFEAAGTGLQEQQLQSPEERLLVRAWQHLVELDEELSGARQMSLRARASRDDHAGGAAASSAAPGLRAQDLEWLLAGVEAHAPAPHSSHLVLVVSSCTARASFSNVPFWRSINGEVQLVLEHKAASPAFFGEAPPAMIGRARTIVGARPVPLPRLPPLPPSTSFRQRVHKAELRVGAVSAVLCDDKPSSFGAPDVLQAEATQLEAVYIVEDRLPGHDPQVTGRVALRAAASFLNSSTSRWEVLLHPWPLATTLSDPVNPMFKSNRTKYVWTVSDQMLQVRFHPSCLLTLGDALAFVRLLTDPAKSAWSPTSPGDIGQAVAGTLPMEEQMALGAPVTARVPQRYLIHNQTGLDLWYSVEQGRPGRGFRLPNYCREELRVAPVRQWVRTVTKGGTTVSRRQASVIHIQPEGSWNPILCVPVDEVGKFRYPLQTPLTDVQVPIIVDVSLAGRTKIVRLHSSLWLHNSTALTLKLQVHLPPSQFSGLVVLAPGDTWGASAQDLRLQPLRPDEGRYLPVAAALGGVLRVVPEGYQSGGADVIRLCSDMKRLKEQEGYIACNPASPGRSTARQSFEGGISVVTSLPALAPSQRVHLAVQVKAKVRDSWLFAGSNLLHSPAPGEFLRLEEALESTIRIQPTLILTNALPYFLRLTVASSPVARVEDTKVAKLPPGATQDLYLDRSVNLFMAASIPQLDLSSAKAVLINRTSASEAWSQADLATSITMTRREEDDGPESSNAVGGGAGSEASMINVGHGQASVPHTPLVPSTPQPSFQNLALAATRGTPLPPTAPVGQPPQPLLSPFTPNPEAGHRRSRSGSSISDILRRNLPRSAPNSTADSPLHPANKPPFISLLPPTPIRLPTITSPATPLYPKRPLCGSSPASGPASVPAARPSPATSATSPPPTTATSHTSSPHSAHQPPSSPSSPLWPPSPVLGPSHALTIKATSPDHHIPHLPQDGSQPTTPDLDPTLPFICPPGWTTNPTYSMSLRSSPGSSPATAPAATPGNCTLAQSPSASASPTDQSPTHHSRAPTSPTPQPSPLSASNLPPSKPQDQPITSPMPDATPSPSPHAPDVLLTTTSSNDMSPLPWPPPPHSPLSTSGLSPSVSPLRPVSPSPSPFHDSDPLPAHAPHIDQQQSSGSGSPDIIMVPYPSRHPSQTDPEYVVPDQSNLVPFPGIDYSPNPTNPATPTQAATAVSDPTHSPSSSTHPQDPTQSQAPRCSNTLPHPNDPTRLEPSGPVAEADEASSTSTTSQGRTSPATPPAPPAEAVAASLASMLTPATSNPMLTPSTLSPRFTPYAMVPELASTPLPPVRPISPPPDTTPHSNSQHRRTVSLPSGMDALATPDPAPTFATPGAGQEPAASAAGVAPSFASGAGGAAVPSCFPHATSCLHGGGGGAAKWQVPCSSPDTLELGIANSLTSQSHDRATCKVVLFCPVWVHNRTGLPLILHDDPPLLAPGPLASLLRHSPVLSAHIKTDAFDRGGTRRGKARSLQEAPQRARPTLLNNTRTLRFSLQPEGHQAASRHTRSFNINTIGIKTNIEIKGGSAAATAAAASSANRQQRQQPQHQLRVHQHEHQPDPSVSFAAHWLPAVSDSPLPPGGQRRASRRASADSIQPSAGLARQTEEPQVLAPKQARHLAGPAADLSPPATWRTADGALAASAAAAAGISAPPEARDQQLGGQQDSSGAPDALAASQAQGLAGTAGAAAAGRAVAEATEDGASGQTASVTDGRGAASTSCGPHLGSLLPRQPHARRVQRLHQFAVEVRPAPADGVFRRSKVVTIKNKYLIMNDTDVTIEVKQADTPDPSVTAYGSGRRFARALPPGARCAWHWDNALLPLELVMRPAATGSQGQAGASNAWNWSGSFPLPDREDYFGLRVRHKQRRNYMIIPVNITVGTSRSVLIAFKRASSLPPYRIENRCHDVVVMITQGHQAADSDKAALPILQSAPPKEPANLDWDTVQPGQDMPFAWDTPPPSGPDRKGYRLLVRAYVRGSEPPPSSMLVQEIRMDNLQDQVVIDVPYHKPAAVPSSSRGPMSRNSIAREELRHRLASALAAECARKVHASVYADGPTRVLCFSDEKRAVEVDDETSLESLKGRLQQVSEKLRDTSARLQDRYAAPPTAADDRLGGDGSSSVRGTSLPSDTSHAPRTLPRPGSQAANLAQLGASPSVASVLYPTAGSTYGIPHGATGSTVSMPRGPYYPPALPGMPGLSHTASTLSALLPPEVEADLYGDGRGPRQGPVRQTDILREMELGPVGGDLVVKVREAKGLRLPLRAGHAAQYVRVVARGARGGEVAAQSAPGAPVTMLDGTKRVEWGFEEQLRDVDASHELLLEVYGMHVRDRITGQGMVESWVSKQRTFLGCVTIPLQHGPPIGPATYPLMRRKGSEDIAGELVVELEWQVTKHGLLLMEVSALERIVADRLEVLARMSPVPVDVSSTWLADVGHAAAEAQLGSPSTTPAPSLQTLSLSGARSSSSSLHLGTPQQLRAVDKAAVGRDVLQGMAQMMESYSINLDIHVLELCNLPFRSGWTLDMAAAISHQLGGMASSGGTPVDLLHLPHAMVEVTLLDTTRAVHAPHRSVAPRLHEHNRLQFEDVPLGAEALVRVYDKAARAKKGRRLLGELTLPIRKIPGTDPLYVWLSLTPPHSRKHAHGHGPVPQEAAAEELPPPKMFARIQITKPAERGLAVSLRVQLAGVGVLAVRGVAEELIHFQADRLGVAVRQGSSEMHIAATVRAIQLDNQLFQAKQPVVLAPTGGAGADADGTDRAGGSGVAAGGTSAEDGDVNDSLHGPLIKVVVVRSYANSMSATQAAPESSGINVGGSMALADGRREGSIVSFKRVAVAVGAVDLRLEELFLEAALLYASQLPLDDLWQTQEWREMQDRMQGVVPPGRPQQGGAALPSAARPLAAGHTPAGQLVRGGRAGDAIAWLLQRDASELEAMLAQSSTWFFLEKAELGDLLLNVTVSLSSRSLFGSNDSQQQQDDGSSDLSTRDFHRQALKGVFQRLVGGSGFQLINVSNVHLQLDHVATANTLTNRSSLMAGLARHYTWQALKEARKVLGGAGPAIAQIPASLLWAGFSLLDLTRDLAARRVAATSVLPRFGFLVLMLGSQITGVASRAAMALLAALPARAQSRFSDVRAIHRFVKRPSNAVEAFTRAALELIFGFVGGAVGLVLDPAAGLQATRGMMMPLGFLLGLLKGALGLGVRPAAALVEALSKMLQGGALICLGKQGIQGSLQRRVMVPGTLGANLTSNPSPQDSTLALASPQLLQMWQRALQQLVPAAAADTVVDVFATRSSRISGPHRAARVMVLTSAHLAYLKAIAHQDGTTSYRVKWVVPKDAVYNVRAVGQNHKVVIDFYQPVEALRGRISLRLPRQRSLRCLPETQHRTILRIAHHSMPDKARVADPAPPPAIDPAPVHNLNIARPRRLLPAHPYP